MLPPTSSSFLLSDIISLLSARRPGLSIYLSRRTAVKARPGYVWGGGHLSKALHRVSQGSVLDVPLMIRTELGLRVEQKASCPSGTSEENGCCLKKTRGRGRGGRY